MTRYGNGPVGRRLIGLFNAMQRRETPVIKIAEMAVSCGINPRQLLADQFRRGSFDA
jgi:hypothetical protein